ncbi:MAG TPA: alkaline phosphatase family protein, partial [Gemmataceae bacterium]|nr:alkaline phosphatase family protein [Gemmataceae bacterium]
RVTPTRVLANAATRMGLAGALCLLAVLLDPTPAHAYIGPGAGFAIAGSFLAAFAAIFSAVLLLITWPLRLIGRVLFGRRRALGRFKRVVILGLDGLDHALTERMLGEGKLPHLDALRKRGCFKPLATTLPSISPVAWSSFQTGTNPGKHNIYDFLTPDLLTYRPKLSSVEIRPPRRVLRLGQYRIPLGRADVRLLRKSRPFWNYLGDRGVFSSVLRVPITFPPEKLRGVLLSAMCAPDLRGTQGMFSYYTTRPQREGERTGGEVHRVALHGDTIRADLVGPENPLVAERRVLKAPFTVTLKGESAVLKIDGTTHDLRRDEYTDWVRVRFRAAPGFSVWGACKFLLLEAGAHFGLYVTPINIDSESPVMPVSEPFVYSRYLTRRQGTFATLGLAEDTWAVNEHVLGDDHFLRQCLDADDEREAMFFDALDKVPEGLCVAVFDGTDRLQHMFWRDIDPTHPARAEHPVPEGRDRIGELYRRMDDLVGRTMAKCGDDELLMVISDHGFNGFRRGIDLNRWLEENGYLCFHEGRRGEEFLAGVDWSRTRAFAVGLTGIYVNLRGKFSQGIVESGAEADKLRDEIAGRLTGLVDPQTGASAVRNTYVTSRVYRGGYKDDAPDLIPGWQRGYRVSWETAIGRGTESVFHDNTKAWSGDHCIDPPLIPGVLFCNRPIETERCRLMDVGPTVLDLFGVPVPEHMDGKPLVVT